MDVVRFPVRVKAGAKRDAVGGCWDGARGRALLVTVRAPAADGKANEAVRRTVAAALSVPRSALDIVAGQRSRDKVIAWQDPPEGGAERIAELRDGGGSP